MNIRLKIEGRDAGQPGFRETWASVCRRASSVEGASCAAQHFTLHAPRSDATRSAGFALVEVLLAAFMLAFLILSLYGAFSFGFKVIKVSQEGVRADQILTDKLEALRLCNWSSVTNGYLPDHFSVTNQGTVFSGTISITQPTMAESYASMLRQVNLTVSWDSGGGTRTRRMNTLVSQYGIATYKP